MQAFGSRRVVMMFELIERGIKRAKGMAQETVIGFDRAAIRFCADRMRTLIVGGRDPITFRVARINMRERDRAPTQCGEEQQCDTRTAFP